MLTFILVPSVLLGTLAIASACGRPKAAVQLNIRDDGRQVELYQGQWLAVSLEANPSTGYEWERGELDDQILRPMGEPELKPQSDLVRAPGIQAIRLQAVGAGKTTLKLIYHRRWEEGVEPSQTYSAEVTVR